MELDQMIKALGEPMRYRIFQQILERKHCVRSLSKKLGITESAVSQHMKVLREAELVYGERCGYHIHYLPVQEALDHMAAAFERMRKQSLGLDRAPGSCCCEFRRCRDGLKKDGELENGPKAEG